MASYLGKISAIVSANTAGYVRNLNDAAAQTRAFARTIRTDISRSSRDANKAFESILSPLQRLQRALEAATSSRNVLAFKGIEGTIQNVKQLRQQVNEIKDLQVAVRLTGASGIDDLRENLRSLSSTDIQAAVRVTGSEDVDQLQRRLNRFNDRTVNLLVQAAGAQNVDALSEKIDSLDDRELRLAVRAINENAIDSARQKLEQLTSASAEIAKPLAAANQQLTGFASEIQAALLPGFSQVQKAALQLEQDIQSGARIGEERYARLRQVVEQTASAVQAVGQVDLGSPEAIRRFESQLSAVNEAALEIASRQLRIDVRSEELEQVRQEIERVEDELRGVRSGAVRLKVNAEEAVEAKRAIDRLSDTRVEIQARVDADSAELSRLDEQISSLQRQVEVQATATADASELNALRDRLSELQGQRVEVAARIRVDSSELNDINGRLEQAKNRLEQAPAEVRIAADFVDLTRQVNQAKQQISDLANNRVGVELDASEALVEIGILEREIESLESQRATIRTQFDDAARREAEALSAEIDSLTARRIEIEADVQVNDEDLQRSIRLLEEARNAAAQIEFNNQAVADSRARREEEAESIRRVSEALARLREQSDFIITGDVQNFDQVRSELSSILGQISQLDESARSRFDLNIGAINRIVSEGSLQELSTARRLLDELNDGISETRRVTLETAEAQRAADQLAATVRELKENADFVITGRPQNFSQVKQELDRVTSSLRDLTEEQRGQADIRVRAVIDAIGREDLGAAQQELALLKQEAEAGASFNLDAESAKRAADDLARRLSSIKDNINFTVTGEVQNFDQARQQLGEILGDIRRIDEGAKEAFTQRLQFAGEIVEKGQIDDLEAAKSLLAGIRAELDALGPAGFTDSLGPSLDDPSRQVDVLKGRITSLKGQLDRLPEPIRRQFLPEIERLEQSFRQASASPEKFADEIEKANAETARLEAQVRRVNAAQGLGSFADGLNDTALRGAIGNLQALQQILNRVGATAGSEAAKQFDRMRNAIQRATDEGTIGSEAFQQELRQIAQEAATAAAATGKIGKSAAFQEIQRGGDIARGGFDKLSLATQQAAFAIDDFFSATGDFTQRIRAVQNNVTQLAFILGDTKGLFIGLGVAIAAQAAVALFKWSQAGVEAKDKTEALNESLARQKSLVEDLKQAFDSLGSSLGRGIFDDATERARELDKLVRDIRDKASDVERERVASLDSDVQRERGFQAARQRDLESETDAGRRVILQSQIEQSRRREQAASEAAFDRGTPNLGDIRQQVVEGILEQNRRRLAADPVGGPNPQAAAALGQSFSRSGISASVGPGGSVSFDPASGFENVFAAAEGVQGRLDDLAARSQELDGEFFGTASRERAAIEEEAARLSVLLQQLQGPLRLAAVELGTSVLRDSQGISNSLRESLEIISSSLDGQGDLLREQRRLAADYARIRDELRSGLSQDGSILTDDAIQARQRELAAIERQSQELESATRSTRVFAETLDRVAGDLAETVAGEARSAATQARRDVNRTLAERQTLPADATAQQRFAADQAVEQAVGFQEQAEANASAIERQRRVLQADQQLVVEDFQQRARLGGLGREIQQIIVERDNLREQIDSGRGDAGTRNRLTEVEAELAREFEQTGIARRLRERADAIDQEQQRFNATQERQQQERDDFSASVERGADLLKTPEQRAAEEGVKSFNDAINASVENLAAQLNQFAPNIAALEDGRLTLSELGGVFAQFPALRDQFIQDLQVARENVAGNISAQIAQFDAERSRPSRAALQAQDVNTQQGRAELNRLLRGDDANRDQPILQGIKEQTGVLKLIDSRINEVGRAVGVAGI